VIKEANLDLMVRTWVDMKRIARWVLSPLAVLFIPTVENVFSLTELIFLVPIIIFDHVCAGEKDVAAWPSTTA